MKAVLCQGKPLNGPNRDVIIDYWKELLAEIPEISSVDFRDNFNAAEVDEIAADYDLLLGCWIQDDMLSDDFFNRHPNLKYITTFGHGFGRFDKDVVRKHGVTITNTIYGDSTIAQYGMGMLLNICHHVDKERVNYKIALDKGMTARAAGQVATRQIELLDKTIGILGLGSIGYWMAKMAAGFGMKVIAYSRHKKEDPKYDFIEQVSLEELYERSDVISVHCPLTDQTKGMLNKEAFEKMKDGVILINTARGAIIDEDALIEALNSGKVYAAGLDVVVGEPIDHKSPIFACENAEITAHIAWAPEEARYRTCRIAVENLKNYLAGNPTSVIS